MASLPQLVEEDIQELNGELQALLSNCEATTALLIDKGGFLITARGNQESFDLTTLGALAAASFAATQGIAGLVSETNFSSVYQQGENLSMLVVNVDEHCLLVVIFEARVGVGAVKYYAADMTPRVAIRLKRAWERDPESSVDLSMLNLSDTSGVFRKKTE